MAKPWMEVIDGGDEGSWFTVVPGFRVRKEGDPVVVTDQVTLHLLDPPPVGPGQFSVCVDIVPPVLKKSPFQCSNTDCLQFML